MEFYKVKLQMIKEKAVICNDSMKSSMDVVAFINSIENYHQNTNETMSVIALSTKNEILAYADISIGAIDYCIMNIPTILQIVLLANAPKFILVHNHPSGNSTPSASDIESTKQLQMVADIMKLQLLDHIVIGDDSYTSIMEELNKK